MVTAPCRRRRFVLSAAAVLAFALPASAQIIRSANARCGASWSFEVIRGIEYDPAHDAFSLLRRK